MHADTQISFLVLRGALVCELLKSQAIMLEWPLAALAFLIGHHLQGLTDDDTLVDSKLAQMVVLALFMLVTECNTCKTLSQDQSDRKGELHVSFLNPSSAAPA